MRAIPTDGPAAITARRPACRGIPAARLGAARLAWVSLIQPLTISGLAPGSGAGAFQRSMAT